jgi:hypothetical protein
MEHHHKFSFIKDFMCDLEEDLDENTLTHYHRMRDSFFERKRMVFASEREQFPGSLPICGMPSFEFSLTPIEELEPPAKKSKIDSK